MGNEQAILSARASCPYPDLDVGECLNQLSTGDILLTHASGTFSGGIEWITDSPWSHSGIVVKDERYRNGEVLIWETMRRENRMDVIQDKVIPGATLSSLREKIEIYSGSYMAFRKLSVPPEVRSQINEKFPSIIAQYDSVPFDENQAHYLVAVDGGRHIPEVLVKKIEDDDEHPHRLFCSRLAAITYHKLGLLDLEGRHPMQFVPRDFSSRAAKPLKLLPGCSLGPEFFVRLPHMRVPSAPTVPCTTKSPKQSALIGSQLFNLDGVEIKFS